MAGWRSLITWMVTTDVLCHVFSYHHTGCITGAEWITHSLCTYRYFNIYYLLQLPFSLYTVWPQKYIRNVYFLCYIK